MSNNPTQQLFFILAIARSGSTWLQQTLNTHPDVNCLFEPSNTRFFQLFRRFSYENEPASTDPGVGKKRMLMRHLPLSYFYPMDLLASKLQAANAPLVGAKITYIQLFRHFDTEEFFIRHRHAKLVLLNRNVLTDALCSRVIAKRTGVWNSSVIQHDSLKPFAIDSKRSQQYFMRNLMYEHRTRFYAQSLSMPHIDISYEDMMGQKQPQVLAQVSDFLGVSLPQGRSELKKIVVQPYRDIITNYNELIAVEQELRQKMMLPVVS